MAKKKNDKLNENEKEKNKEEKEKGNVYDRIVKEDSDSTFDMFMETKYGVKIENCQSLPEKIPRTLERELDALYKSVTEKDGEKLFHIEYQTKNDNEMVRRVQEYNSLIYRKYGIPIKHVVVYYGNERTKMITQLPEEAIFRGFDLICLYEIEVEKFLNSPKPEVVILAPLGKYEKEQKEEILNLTISRLEQLPKYVNNPSRYISKLLFYSKLRNLDETLKEKIKTMPIFTNEMIKDHVLYKDGKEEGLELRKQELIEVRQQALKKERELKQQAQKEKQQALKKERELKQQAQKEKQQALKKERELKQQAQKEKQQALKKERELKQQAEKKERELKQQAQKKEIQAIINLHTKGVDIKIIAESYNISQKRVKEVIVNWKKQEGKK